MARKLIARLIVVILLRIVTGYAVGTSLANDAATGRELTLKQYIDDFESHKEKLVSSDMSMGVAIFVGVLMLVLVFALYELLVFAVDRVLRLADRPSGVAAQPGGPPGW